MKLHIVKPEQESIENYTRVDANPDSLDLSKVSDNECTMILANDILDLFHIDNVPQLLEHLVKKIRMGGELVVGGTDIRLLSRAVVSGSMGVAQANEVLYAKRACSDVNTILDLLRSLGLTIISSKVAGLHYEIESRREA